MGRLYAWLMICDPPQRSLTDLATELGVSKTAVSTVARQLEAGGMIERAPSPTASTATAWSAAAGHRLASTAGSGGLLLRSFPALILGAVAAYIRVGGGALAAVMDQEAAAAPELIRPHRHDGDSELFVELIGAWQFERFGEIGFIDIDHARRRCRPSGLQFLQAVGFLGRHTRRIVISGFSHQFLLRPRHNTGASAHIPPCLSRPAAAAGCQSLMVRFGGFWRRFRCPACAPPRHAPDKIEHALLLPRLPQPRSGCELDHG